MTTPDVNVIVMDFPNTKEKEMITENPDGSYTIFINTRFSYDTQLKAYQHAMQHIKNQDFEKADVQIIEAIAHKKEKQSIPANKFADHIERLRKERKQIQRKLRKKEREIAFVINHCSGNPNDYFMRCAEDYWSYGDDL